MLFKRVNQANGDSTNYQLSPAVKPFTLLDLGFTKSNAGNFVMKHSLGINGPQLKIVVKKDLKLFKMDITDERGLRKVNIFNGKNQEAVKQYKYLIQTLILRKVFSRK